MIQRLQIATLYALAGLLAAAAVPRSALAQEERPCEMPEAKTFDFWLGEWDVSWPGGQGGTPDGKTGHGNNVIRRILDDCILQERFVSEGGFEGMSVSTFNPRTMKWQQTWVDSQGGYLTFTGRFRDGIMDLRTEPFTNPQGREQINRMLWQNIRKDSLTWHWQRSLDDGLSWDDLWIIQYVRTKGVSAD